MWYLDLEDSARADVELLIPEPKAPANYKDAEKIAAAKAENRQKMIDSAALNINFARITVLGYGPGPFNLVPCRNEDEEMIALRDFWENWTADQCPPLCGFFNSQFDVPLMVRRSEILDVHHPSIKLSKYQHPLIIDLAQILTFDWMLDAEKLTTYAKVFGIPVTDTTKGSEMPALAAAGDYESIIAHCRADLELTKALAERMRVA